MIKPTVGRKLYFIPAKHDTATIWYDRDKENPQPLDATINYVWGDTCINAAVVDNAGVTRMQNSCPLVQEGEPAPADGYYCYWMPYQVGQAKAPQPERERMTIAGSDVGSFTGVLGASAG